MPDPIHSEATESVSRRLVLEIEVPDFYVSDEQEFADEHGLTLLDIVTEEWMRPEVGITLVSIPGEKCMNSDSEVHARVGRIVGARITDA